MGGEDDVVWHAPGSLTGGLLAREVACSDLPVFYDHQLDSDANRMAAFSPRGREAFVAHWSRILADGATLARTIVVDGQVVGNIVSFDVSGVREVGYWIGREHWGMGVATAAPRAFLSVEGICLLYAHVARHNEASRRVLEKRGFTLVSGARESAETDVDATEDLCLQLAAPPAGRW